MTRKKKKRTQKDAFLKKHHIIDAEKQSHDNTPRGPRTFVLPNSPLFKLLHHFSSRKKKR